MMVRDVFGYRCDCFAGFMRNPNTDKNRDICRSMPPTSCATTDFGHFIDTNDNNVCKKCHPTCEKCTPRPSGDTTTTDEWLCTACRGRGEMLSRKTTTEDFGMCKCPHGMFRPKLDPPPVGQVHPDSAYDCKPCGMYCSDCDDNGKCITCEPNTEKLPDDVNCTCKDQFSVGKNGKCVPDEELARNDCKYDEVFDDRTNSCGKCHPTCLTCWTVERDDKCKKDRCKDPNMFYDDAPGSPTYKCLCKEGFFMTPDWTCKPCAVGCKSCTNDFDTCTCGDNTSAYVPADNKCPCDTTTGEWSPMDLACGPPRTNLKCRISEFWDTTITLADKCN
jgi:hypothetical protein